MSKVKKYKIFYLVICIIIFIIGIYLLQNYKRNSGNITYKSIDEYIEKQMKDGDIPGLSIAIVKDDKIVYTKGYGIADNTNRKITSQTPFSIDSLSKSFCGLAIRQLINENKINLDVPVQKYIPWFHLADEDESKKITVRSLLDHKSGISTAAGNQYYIFSDKYTRKQLVESFSKLGITKPVGTTYQYSNINYIILGQVVEEVSGMTYESYIQKYIFTPLKMNNTFYSKEEAKKNGLTEGYQLIFGFPVITHPVYPTGCLSEGFILSSAEDMGRYITTLVNEGMYNGYNVTSQDGHTPLGSTKDDNIYYDSYWNIYKGSIPNNTTGHNGGYLNSSSAFNVLPYNNQNLGIIVLANTRTDVLAGNFIKTSITPETISWGIAKNFYFPYSIQNPNPASVKLFFFIFDFILLQFIIFTIIRAAGVKVWLKKIKQNSKPAFKSIAFSTVTEFLLPAALIIFIVSRIKLANLTMALANAPDFMLTINIAAAILIISYLIKTVYLIYNYVLKNREDNDLNASNIK
jgi:CubicO group peptidase (beta-lactamase class C family)